MRIAIIGAAGKAGRLIADEARRRGHTVVGFGRTQGEHIDRAVDVFELAPDDLAGFDVVVDALGFFEPETLSLHTTSLLHLADLVSHSAVRLVVVGGAGSLYVDADHTVQLKDTPDFPEVFRPLASAQADQLARLRDRSDVAWTYISPAADFQADGIRSGDYALAGEQLELNAAGESVLSYADYAIAVVDEIEGGAHVRQRISIRSR